MYDLPTSERVITALVLSPFTPHFAVYLVLNLTKFMLALVMKHAMM
jgi:hypothetical protein